RLRRAGGAQRSRTEATARGTPGWRPTARPARCVLLRSPAVTSGFRGVTSARAFLTTGSAGGSIPGNCRTPGAESAQEVPMTGAPSQVTGRPGRAALASSIGAVVEWYDFLLYGIVAAVVFDRAFFPEISSMAGTMAGFATH